MNFTARICASVAVALALGSAGAQAADWKPERPIRFVVPFGPGGATDIVARVLAGNLTHSLRQPVVVDNRPGAGAVIGTTIVKDAAPDGYTVMMATIGFGANPALFRNCSLPFNPLTDFTYISQAVIVPTILVVPPSLGIRSPQAFIDRARAQPGTLTFGSSGYGTINHLAGELVKALAGVNMVQVPYRSGGQSTTAVVSGEISALFATVPTSAGYIRSGTMVPLATSGARSVAMLPGLPPMSQTIPGFDVVEWQGIVGPAGIPRNIVDTLNARIVAALRDTDIQKRLSDLGAEHVGSTPEQFEAFVRTEVRRWLDVAERTGMKAED